MNLIDCIRDGNTPAIFEPICRTPRKFPFDRWVMRKLSEKPRDGAGPRLEENKSEFANRTHALGPAEAVGEVGEKLRRQLFRRTCFSCGCLGSRKW